MTSPRSSANLGAGCLALLLAPFAAGGTVGAYQAVRAFDAGETERAVFLATFAAVFCGVGYGGLALALRGRRVFAARLERRASYPEEPWRWRPEWATGRLTDQSRSTMWAAWAFALFWNLIAWPSGVLAVRSALHQGNRAAWAGMLFPAIGAGLLVWALRGTLRYRAFGASTLALDTWPAAIGHSLSGTLRAPSHLRPADGFLITLTCLRRHRSGGGENRTTHETVLWQEEGRSAGRIERDATGARTSVPIAFRLPTDLPSFDDSDADNAVIWRLSAEADVPGVDYQAVFEVPVFRTAASERPLTDAEARALPLLPAAEYRHPADAAISVSVVGKMTEIAFPAGRNPSAAIGLTAFTLIWWLATWAAVHFGAPWIFPAASGAIGLLLGWAVLDAWAGVSRVRVDRVGVRIATGLVAPGRERLVPASDVAEVRAAIGMQAGTRPYYDILVVRRGGKPVAAGRAVRNKREAEWLAATIRRAVRGD